MRGPIFIGQMAKAGNCKVQTIRYYEEIGLLTTPKRTEGNQRIYTQEQLKALLFIRHSRELGFSLPQIKKMLQLNGEPDHSCHDIDQIAKEHLLEVESRIARLQSMQNELIRMIGHCEGRNIATCRIIETLADHELCSNLDQQDVSKQSESLRWYD